MSKVPPHYPRKFHSATYDGPGDINIIHAETVNNNQKAAILPNIDRTRQQSSALERISTNSPQHIQASKLCGESLRTPKFTPTN